MPQVVIKDSKERVHYVDSRLDSFIKSAHLTVIGRVLNYPKGKPVSLSHLDLTGGGVINYASLESGDCYVCYYGGNPSKVQPLIFKVAPEDGSIET